MNQSKFCFFLIGGFLVNGLLVNPTSGHAATAAQSWGAISPYHFNVAMKSLKNNPASPWEPAPFCFFIGKRGKVKFADQCKSFFSNPKRWTKAPLACGLQNIQNQKWDAEVVKQDPALVARNMSTLMKKKGCQQLILDIESLRAEDRIPFTQWVKTFSETLKKSLPHTLLSIAVHAKTEPQGTWSGAQAQDWAALCAVSDELLIMAYDFHLPGATPPGEVAPDDWVKKVLEYAAGTCPAAKLRLGLAAYGYRWPGKEIVTEAELRAQATPLPYIETAEKRDRKLKLAAEMGIARFFLWARGME